jgi:hypothetical protein
VVRMDSEITSPGTTSAKRFSLLSSESRLLLYSPTLYLLIVAKTPLSFSPRTGPIDLIRIPSETATTEDGEIQTSTGPINLFDEKSYKKPSVEPMQEIQTEEKEQEIRTEGGIWAPTDPDEFVFDWPSDEIREACEGMFANDKECILPALNWIAEEKKRVVDLDEMQDVQEH